MSTAALAAFLIFCRVGGCLMLMPGIGGRNIPVNVRLFLALAVSLAFVPLLFAAVEDRVRDVSQAALGAMVAAEMGTGAIIGLLARIYIDALQSLANFIAQAVGVASMPGVSVSEDEPLPSVAVLFGFTAVALMFMADQHHALVRSLVDSYARIPTGSLLGARPALVDVVDQLTAAYLLALRMASPFILYSIVVNFAVGIINKFTPQIPVYFIATPFIMAGGLILIYMIFDQLMMSFLAAFGQWLQHG